MYGIAVQGVNYFNSHGALKKGEETGLFLYQNYFCKKFGLMQTLLMNNHNIILCYKNKI